MESNNDNHNSSSKGIGGFCSILAIVFIVLKLTHYINWPWFWVLSPIWIPIALIILVLVIIGIVAVINSR